MKKTLTVTSVSLNDDTIVVGGGQPFSDVEATDRLGWTIRFVAPTGEFQVDEAIEVEVSRPESRPSP